MSSIELRESLVAFVRRQRRAQWPAHPTAFAQHRAHGESGVMHRFEIFERHTYARKTNGLTCADAGRRAFRQLQQSAFAFASIARHRAKLLRAQPDKTVQSPLKVDFRRLQIPCTGRRDRVLPRASQLGLPGQALRESAIARGSQDGTCGERREPVDQEARHAHHFTKHVCRRFVGSARFVSFFVFPGEMCNSACISRRRETAASMISSSNRL